MILLCRPRAGRVPAAWPVPGEPPQVPAIRLRCGRRRADITRHDVPGRLVR